MADDREAAQILGCMPVPMNSRAPFCECPNTSGSLSKPLIFRNLASTGRRLATLVPEEYAV